MEVQNKSEKDNNGKGKDNSEDEDMINATSVDFLLVHEFESANLVDNTTSWMIDNSASFLITSRRNLFTSYTPGDFGSVKMAIKVWQDALVLDRFAWRCPMARD